MFANARSYEQFMGRWSRLIAVRLIELVNVSDEGQLLDIGSGTGALSFVIAERKPKTRVVGIDASKEYVAYANSLNPLPDRITFEVGDARHLRFANATFASTVSLLAFNFIPDPLKALEEARRVTVPGGSVAAAVWDYGGDMRMLRIFWDASAALNEAAEKLDEAHMPLCRSGELSDLWNKVGFKNVQQHPVDVEMHFDSFEDYWRPFLLGQGPAGAYTANLDPTALQRLREELRRRLTISGDDVSFVLPARAWAVCGTVPIR